jgi:hypothetical protein
VVKLKVALVAPAGTVTVAGTVPTEVGLEDNVTGKPPVGAGPERVTVPTEAVPPITEVGFIVSPVRAGAVMVSVPFTDTPSADAVIVAVAFDATPIVVTVNVAELAPDAMVTDAGTVAVALFEDNATV